MTLGERCDEIVRLIDATLEACGHDAPAAAAGPADASTGEPTMATRVRGVARTQRGGLARTA